ncbi:BON domain-containing protein [Lignipirellula cremea]|uniref:BON domain-containing protein n=1 Tax=Lignipirellula cremea TaxID=2528010 RepID=UPI0011A8E5F6|nr:BON domain-containing protein [Lignipirellula cremea]
MSQAAALDVASRAQSALEQSPIYLLRQIRVSEVADCLHLAGRVDSFYHKQMAQELVLAVSDGVTVVNTIAVD